MCCAVSMCLTGEALTVIGCLTADDSLDYKKVKKAYISASDSQPGDIKKNFGKPGQNREELAARISSYMITGLRWPTFLKRLTVFRIMI